MNQKIYKPPKILEYFLKKLISEQERESLPGDFEEMYNRSKDVLINADPLKLKLTISADVIIKEKGLVQVSDESEIEKIVDDIISRSPGEVERFKGGEAKLMGFFVGQVMKETKGKANPKVVNELLRKKLG